ncbi:unnamed protein product [Chrysoparadoxa australica]
MHNEPVLFLQRFRGWERNTNNALRVSAPAGHNVGSAGIGSPTGVAGSTAAATTGMPRGRGSVRGSLTRKHKKRKSKWKVSSPSSTTFGGFEGEIERMHSDHVGTLAMQVRGQADYTRQGITMKLMDDYETSSLMVWRATTEALDHTQPMDESDPAFGVFFSKESYVIVFSCKNVTRSIVYLWVGSEASVITKASLALQVKDLIKDLKLAEGANGCSGAIDQVRVIQGKEPPFLQAVFKMRGRSLVVVAGSSETGSYRCQTQPVVLAVRQNSAFEGGVMASELNLSIARQHGLHQRMSYVVVPALPDGVDTQTEPVVYVWQGVTSPAGVTALAEELAMMPVRMLYALFGSQNWEAARYLNPLTNFSHGKDEEPEELSRLLGRDSESTLRGAAPTVVSARPVRLWEISKRKQIEGIPYCEEVGHAETFAQDTLDERLAYILDTGDAELLVWHGALAAEADSMLCAAIAGEYMMLLQAQDIKMAENGKIRHVPSGREGLEFLRLFRVWDEAKHPLHRGLRGKQEGAEEAADSWLGFHPDSVSRAQVQLPETDQSESGESAESSSDGSDEGSRSVSPLWRAVQGLMGGPKGSAKDVLEGKRPAPIVTRPVATHKRSATAAPSGHGTSPVENAVQRWEAAAAKTGHERTPSEPKGAVAASSSKAEEQKDEGWSLMSWWNGETVKEEEEVTLPSPKKQTKFPPTYQGSPTRKSTRAMADEASPLSPPIVKRKTSYQVDESEAWLQTLDQRSSRGPSSPVSVIFSRSPSGSPAPSAPGSPTSSLPYGSPTSATAIAAAFETSTSPSARSPNRGSVRGSVRGSLNTSKEPDVGAALSIAAIGKLVEVEQWIERKTGLPFESPDDLQESLMDGMLLCMLINVLEPGSVVYSDSTVPFKQQENISMFTQACKRYGLPAEDTFYTSDLYQGKNLEKVVNSLSSLKALAEEKESQRAQEIMLTLAADAEEEERELMQLEDEHSQRHLSQAGAEATLSSPESSKGGDGGEKRSEDEDGNSDTEDSDDECEPSQSAISDGMWQSHIEGSQDYSRNQSYSWERSNDNDTMHQSNVSSMQFSVAYEGEQDLPKSLLEDSVSQLSVDTRKSPEGPSPLAGGKPCPLQRGGLKGKSELSSDSLTVMTTMGMNQMSPGTQCSSGTVTKDCVQRTPMNGIRVQMFEEDWPGRGHLHAMNDAGLMKGGKGHARSSSQMSAKTQIMSPFSAASEMPAGNPYWDREESTPYLPACESLLPLIGEAVLGLSAQMPPCSKCNSPADLVEQEWKTPAPEGCPSTCFALECSSCKEKTGVELCIWYREETEKAESAAKQASLLLHSPRAAGECATLKSWGPRQPELGKENNQADQQKQLQQQKQGHEPVKASQEDQEEGKDKWLFPRPSYDASHRAGVGWGNTLLTRRRSTRGFSGINPLSPRAMASPGVAPLSAPEQKPDSEEDICDKNELHAAATAVVNAAASVAQAEASLSCGACSDGVAHVANTEVDLGGGTMTLRCGSCSAWSATMTMTITTNEHYVESPQKKRKPTTWNWREKIESALSPRAAARALAVEQANPMPAAPAVEKVTDAGGFEGDAGGAVPAVEHACGGSADTGGGDISRASEDGEVLASSISEALNGSIEAAGAAEETEGAGTAGDHHPEMSHCKSAGMGDMSAWLRTELSAVLRQPPQNTSRVGEGMFASLMDSTASTVDSSTDASQMRSGSESLASAAATDLTLSGLDQDSLLNELLPDASVDTSELQESFVDLRDKNTSMPVIEEASLADESSEMPESFIDLRDQNNSLSVIQEASFAEESSEMPESFVDLRDQNNSLSVIQETSCADESSEMPESFIDLRDKNSSLSVIQEASYVDESSEMPLFLVNPNAKNSSLSAMQGAGHADHLMEIHDSSIGLSGNNNSPPATAEAAEAAEALVAELGGLQGGSIDLREKPQSADYSSEVRGSFVDLRGQEECEADYSSEVRGTFVDLREEESEADYSSEVRGSFVDLREQESLPDILSSMASPSDDSGVLWGESIVESDRSQAEAAGSTKSVGAPVQSVAVSAVTEESTSSVEFLVHSSRLAFDDDESDGEGSDESGADEETCPTISPSALPIAEEPSWSSDGFEDHSVVAVEEMPRPSAEAASVNTSDQFWASQGA